MNIPKQMFIWCNNCRARTQFILEYTKGKHTAIYMCTRCGNQKKFWFEFEIKTNQTTLDKEVVGT